MKDIFNYEDYISFIERGDIEVYGKKCAEGASKVLSAYTEKFDIRNSFSRNAIKEIAIAQDTVMAIWAVKVDSDNPSNFDMRFNNTELLSKYVLAVLKTIDDYNVRKMIALKFIITVTVACVQNLYQTARVQTDKFDDPAIALLLALLDNGKEFNKRFTARVMKETETTIKLFSDIVNEVLDNADEVGTENFPVIIPTMDKLKEQYGYFCHILQVQVEQPKDE